MAGSCCGRTYRVDAPVDPAPCNALTRTAGGLLVPHTALQGIAPGGAVSAQRSVDIDVTAPAAGACPETWQVGARLTPVSGQTSGAAGLGGSPYDTWVAVPATLTLPEAGVYELDADVQGGVIMVGSVSNSIVQARLFDVAANAVVPLTARTLVLFAATPAAGVTHTLHGNASASALYQVAGPTTIRVEGLKHVDSGTTTGEVVAATNFRFKKVSD
ncbi:hypothetical protein OOK58_42970 [Streptomyces sp. NBC_01728]|uniref:hypothetical protein n=1 Tax=unclassified Streptomyces TaxID=2593676 RepID=UPI002254B7B4|nr:MULTISPECIES: hypothetical protein [unclassified Streptomyces]MCX4458675.1 hypothetical protein [Streptomyces sp. NBC_01719]MCX4498032.1 hypothetical protein [Streptomyces sp. NBC_01728]